MREGLSKQEEKRVLPENNFSGVLGGHRLASIRLSMPHHDQMQHLVGDVLKKFF